jgi:protein-disulfide isomerase
MNESSTPPKTRNLWGLAIVMLIVGFFAGLLAAPRTATSIVANSPASSNSDLITKAPIVLTLEQNGQKSQIVGNPLLADASSGATYILGEASAKITMIEFGDYRCGYCRLFSTQTFPRIMESYIKTGKIRYIYRDTVSVGGEQTVTVSSVAACANEQGKFWDFHQLAHNNLEAWGNTNGAELIKTLTQLSSTQLGLKANDLNTCISSNRHAARLNTDIELSRRFGVTGTPSFVINGYFFSGALPFEVYQKIFESFGVV